VLPTRPVGWVGGRVAFALLIALPLLASDAPLFPVPLHLVRRVEDPIAGSTVEVDEYCSGNRIITISGSRTAIVDYEHQELLEIDRAAYTYSIATFDEIARSKAVFDRPRPTNESTASIAWKTTPLGVTQSRTGRSADSFEITTDKIKVQVAVDRQVTLSRAALDAISGAGYPNKSSDQQEAVARVCARNADVPGAKTTGVVAYGLPLEQSIAFEAGAATPLTVRNTIVRMTNELPPPELLAIPAGAKLVDSRAAQMQKVLRELGDVAPASRP
jgi:hypothetical protein